jgi:L-glutamine-phosphate cytidylyltransferase
MKTVVILAAGVGSRLRPITDRVPKSMVPVNGTPLLARFLCQIVNSGVESKVIIVAGYLSEQINEFVSDADINIDVVINENFETTNNMESCRLALESFDYEDCIIVNADCIYDDKIVMKMLAAHESCIAMDSSQYCEENMKISLREGYVTEISKALPNLKGNYTSIDLYHFVKSDVDRLLEIMQIYNKKCDLQKWNEVAINELVKVSPVKSCDFNGLRWMEIDNHIDLKCAEELFR